MQDMNQHAHDTPSGGSPRISVVVPHFNQPDALRRCLMSLDAQRDDGVPFEVIVVDNGSVEMPEEVCAGLDGVRLDLESKPGPGPARSRGAALARGDILAFIDSDCTADPGWIRGIDDYFSGPDPADFIGGMVRIAPVDPGRLTMVEAFESVYGYRMKLFVACGYTATCNMAVRRVVFDDVGPFGGIGIAEDVDWGLRATGQGYRVAYVPGIGIRTPARESFAELARKWDRHIAHDHAVVPAGAAGWLKWVLRAGIVGASPLGEIPRIATTGLLPGPRARLQCFAGTARIRLYRAGKMLHLAFGGDPSALGAAWRRS